MSTLNVTALQSHAYRLLRKRTRSLGIHSQELPDLVQSATAIVLSATATKDYTEAGVKSLVWLACRSVIRDYYAELTGQRESIPSEITQRIFHEICCASRRQPTRDAKECRHSLRLTTLYSDSLDAPDRAHDDATEDELVYSRIVALLPQRDRIIADCLVADMTTVDIAKTCGMSLRTAWRRINEIKSALALFCPAEPVLARSGDN